VRGRAVRKYIKPNGVRNEQLDTHVGNLAMAHYLGLHKWTNADWARLRRNIVGARAAEIATVPVPADPVSSSSAPVPPGTPPVSPKPPSVPAPAPAPTRRVLSRGLRR